VSINISGTQGMDESRLAREVGRQLDKRSGFAFAGASKGVDY
jgi:hypothetical protein